MHILIIPAAERDHDALRPFGNDGRVRHEVNRSQSGFIYLRIPLVNLVAAVGTAPCRAAIAHKVLGRAQDGLGRA